MKFLIWKAIIKCFVTEIENHWPDYIHPWSYTASNSNKNNNKDPQSFEINTKQQQQQQQQQQKNSNNINNNNNKGAFSFSFSFRQNHCPFNWLPFPWMDISKRKQYLFHPKISILNYTSSDRKKVHLGFFCI